MKIFVVFLLLVQCCLAAETTDLYYVVFLRSAPDRKPLAAGEGERIQEAHMANIHAMADRGVLVAAGPFEDDPPVIRGLFLFKVASLAEAKRIAAEDPTVVEHRNIVDVFPWRGPKGIGEEYKRLHKADPKTPEGMGVQPLFVMSHGNNWRSDSPVLVDHHNYLDKLRQSGMIAADGPVPEDESLAGMIVFERIPDAEARKLVEEDPAVKAGLLRFEPHRWWCAAHVLPK